MNIGELDFDYMVVYKDKRDNTFNTWILGESALRVNYKQMRDSDNVEFLGIYKKVNVSELLDIMTK